MNIVTDPLFSGDAVKNYTDEGRPHIEEVQAVEAVCYHEHISGKDGGICLCTAKVDNEIGTQAADRRIEKRASQSAECKIVGNKLTGWYQNSSEIL